MDLFPYEHVLLRDSAKKLTLSESGIRQITNPLKENLTLILVPESEAQIA